VSKLRYRAGSKYQETTRVYEQLPEVKEKRRMQSRSESGKRNKAKYEATKKGKATRLKAIKRYCQSLKGKANRRMNDEKRRYNPYRVALHKEYHKKYTQTEKGKAMTAMRNARRRAWMTDTPNLLTAAQWLQVLKDNHYRCHYCGTDGKMTLDHVIPLSKGGKHTIDNVVPACPRCNSKKRDKILTML
jgi:5-methylcytosine-specific restriction endonuclease McrA